MPGTRRGPYVSPSVISIVVGVVGVVGPSSRGRTCSEKSDQSPSPRSVIIWPLARSLIL